MHATCCHPGSQRHAGRDTINFNITSSSKVIKPNSPLPAVTEQVTIDGYSQSGASPNTLEVGTDAVLKIVLSGENAGISASGLELRTNNSIVRGLVVQNWNGAGILMSDFAEVGGPNVVQGCYVGTNAAGTIDRPNGNGIQIASDLEVVGGQGPGDRNVISGNGTGIAVGEGVSDAVVMGNYIGTTASGEGALGNLGPGIRLDETTHAQIGGSLQGERNVISGSGDAGIAIVGDGVSDNTNVVEGNYIGTKANGTGDLGNAVGIEIEGGVDNFIGFEGTSANRISGNGTGIQTLLGAKNNRIEGNTISGSNTDGVAFGSGPNTLNLNTITGNFRDGVRVTAAASGVNIANNAISRNGGLGINLVGATENAFGVTANDKNDKDKGANLRQNFPVLTSAKRTASTGVTEVVVTLQTSANTVIRVELFRAIVDLSGNGEGVTRVAAFDTTTNASGDKMFSFLVTGLTVGTPLTATATAKVAGNTSEFSVNRTVIAVP